MNKINVMGREMQITEGMTFGELAKEFQGEFSSAIMLAKQGNMLKELDYEIKENDDITFLDLTTKDGMRVYHRGVSFLLVKAARDILGEDARVVVEHSLRGNVYCEIRNVQVEINEEWLKVLQDKMLEYVAADLPIRKKIFRKDRAIEIAKKQGMQDKVELFRFRSASSVNMYELEGFYDYFYGYMPSTTGVLGLFGLVPHENGFLIRFPDQANPDELLPLQIPEKISRVFMEQMRWSSLMGVTNVADLNNTIVKRGFGELVRINEALHEKKIAEIADQIYQRMDKVRVVLIAGPSSSGKTSFANRLSIQLKALGIRPHKVSLDDYFLNREDTPLDENGKKNFEVIEALDLPQLNEDLKKIIAGEKVELPSYNFMAGKREYNGDFVQLGEGEVLVVEGIHGLNDRLTAEIPVENKFKIFISAITQLNVDDHNRISTSDSRMIRRMVRDFQFRGRDARKTIETWSEVRQGEEDNIFPFQENADAIFNSATLYELCVLKQYAEPQLFAIDPSMPEYITAKRLIKFLGYFLSIPGQEIPNNSLIKEFIGGSCFKV
ncbi:MAG: nucleoside kinase [Anaerotignum sp.]|nr:nucleoside kinase [Anaerotignum sp.]